MKKLLLLMAAIAVCLFAEGKVANVGGGWTITAETPHGKLTGPLDLQQDGAKVTGTCELQMIGKVQLTGSVEGAKITFHFDIPNGPTATFTGVVEGDKMSGSTDIAGAWSATKRQESGK